MDLLAGLGQLLRLRDCCQETEYVGGLDVSPAGEDGQFAYAWHDEFMQGEHEFDLVTVSTTYLNTRYY